MVNDDDRDSITTRCSDAFSVGEYVSDELQVRGWTSAQAVSVLDGDFGVEELWLDLIACDAIWWAHEIKFSHDDAAKLEKIFGIPAATWIGIDSRFQARRRLSMN